MEKVRERFLDKSSIVRRVSKGRNWFNESRQLQPYRWHNVRYGLEQYYHREPLTVLFWTPFYVPEERQIVKKGDKEQGKKLGPICRMFTIVP